MATFLRLSVILSLALEGNIVQCNMDVLFYAACYRPIDPVSPKNLW